MGSIGSVFMIGGKLVQKYPWSNAEGKDEQHYSA
jgi:hypothetical protein